MKRDVLMIAVVALVGGCGKEEAQTNTTKGIPLRVGMEVVYQDRQGAAEKPEPPKDPIEAAIRMVLKNPTGSLTSADLEKVTELRIPYSDSHRCEHLGEAHAVEAPSPPKQPQPHRCQCLGRTHAVEIY